MIILQETSSPQTIKVVPRTLQADSMVLTLEGAGTSETVNISPSIDRYFLDITEVFNIKEGNTYSVEIFNGSETIYKGLIYCTNQAIDNYSINNGEYVQNETNNDFIIID